MNPVDLRSVEAVEGGAFSPCGMDASHPSTCSPWAMCGLVLSPFMLLVMLMLIAFAGAGLS